MNKLIEIMELDKEYPTIYKRIQRRPSNIGNIFSA